MHRGRGQQPGEADQPQSEKTGGGAPAPAGKGLPPARDQERSCRQQACRRSPAAGGLHAAGHRQDVHKSHESEADEQQAQAPGA